MDITLQQPLVFPNEDVCNPDSYIYFASKKHKVAAAFSADLLLAALLRHTPHPRSPAHSTLHALVYSLLIGYLFLHFLLKMSSWLRRGRSFSLLGSHLVLFTICFWNAAGTLISSNRDCFCYSFLH